MIHIMYLPIFFSDTSLAFNQWCEPRMIWVNWLTAQQNISQCKRYPECLGRTISGRNLVMIGAMWQLSNASVIRLFIMSWDMIEEVTSKCCSLNNVRSLIWVHQVPYMFLASSFSCLCPFLWSQVLSREYVVGAAPTGDAPTTSE